MIEVCVVFQQKFFVGFDNIIVEGNEVIDNMVEIVILLGSYGVDVDWVKDVQRRLKEGKRYLKTEFKVYVGREEGCVDYCIIYAFSDVNEERFVRKCLQVYDVYCNNCMFFEKVV